MPAESGLPPRRPRGDGDRDPAGDPGTGARCPTRRAVRRVLPGGAGRTVAVAARPDRRVRGPRVAPSVPPVPGRRLRRQRRGNADLSADMAVPPDRPPPCGGPPRRRPDLLHVISRQVRARPGLGPSRPAPPGQGGRLLGVGHVRGLPAQSRGRHTDRARPGPGLRPGTARWPGVVAAVAGLRRGRTARPSGTAHLDAEGGGPAGPQESAQQHGDRCGNAPEHGGGHRLLAGLRASPVVAGGPVRCRPAPVAAAVRRRVRAGHRPQQPGRRPARRLGCPRGDPHGGALQRAALVGRGSRRCGEPHHLHRE